MADFREQRVCINFCFKLGKTAAETHQMLKQAFGEDTLGHSQTYDWFKLSKVDDPHSGWPSTGITPENVTAVRNTVLEDRRQSIQDMCNIVGLSYGTCQRILSDELNMTTHTAFIIQKFLAKNKMTVVPHPPYLPNRAPCDFLLFPRMKINLKGRRFDTEDIQAESQVVLNKLTKKKFQGASSAWKNRWDRCIHSQGDYFEGDGGE